SPWLLVVPRVIGIRPAPFGGERGGRTTGPFVRGPYGRCGGPGVRRYLSRPARDFRQAFPELREAQADREDGLALPILETAGQRRGSSRGGPVQVQVVGGPCPWIPEQTPE